MLSIIDRGARFIGNEDIICAWEKTKRSIVKSEKDGVIKLTISAKNFRLFLFFGTKKDMVINKFIKIEPSGYGMGSIISLELLKQYTTMGITKVLADPSLNAGGYTWARMGYYAINRIEAENIVKSKFKGKDKKNALLIISSYYKEKKKSGKEPFPMQNLAQLRYKEYLKGTSWYATLNPQNSQRKGMIRYLKCKIKDIIKERRQPSPKNG